MKKYWFFIAFACVTLVLTGCSSSKKASKTPIKTFVMPCSDMVSGDGVLRAWASGKSDSEMSARKKAQVSAAAELASMLDRAVKATTEEYTSNLSESDLGGSKSLLIDKTKIAVEQSLKGAAIVCDRWVKDEATGQYTNYIVMELRGEEYLKKLYDELSRNSVSVDKEMLEKVFLKHIEESINQ